MRLVTTLLALLVLLPAALAFAPTAAARYPPPQCIRECDPIVDVCVAGVTDPSCWKDGMVCVATSRMVPICVPKASIECTEICDPCGTKIACDLPPLVGACVAGVTSPSCFRGGDVCVGFSYQVPVCADVPCYPQIDCIETTSGGPERYCMYYYWEHDNGVIRYVQRDSCTSELYVNGERVK